MALTVYGKIARPVLDDIGCFPRLWPASAPKHTPDNDPTMRFGCCVMGGARFPLKRADKEAVMPLRKADFEAQGQAAKQKATDC